MNRRLKSELESFNGLWKNGYFEGDPLDPLAKSSYGQLGFISTLHATYLRCIKPYVNSNTVSLEIGPGRGAWTKAMLPSKEIYALDALPEENNRFFQYLDYPKNVNYFQVENFKCEMLPIDHFNYMFSYGCLCHVSFEGISEYALNIFPKLKRKSNCFWMVADYDKYNSSMSEVITPTGPKSRQKAEDDIPRSGRWYHAGVERTCSMLNQAGYEIIDSDVGTCLRDPVIHFIKP